MTATRCTDLTPSHTFTAEELRATHEGPWRAHEAPRPFDRARCELLALEGAKSTHGIYEAVMQDLQGRGDELSEQEARFWLRFLSEAPRRAHGEAVDEAQIRALVARVDEEAPMSWEEAEQCFHRFVGEAPTLFYELDGSISTKKEPVVRCVRALFGAVKTAELILDRVPLLQGGEYFHALGPCGAHRAEMIATINRKTTIKTILDDTPDTPTLLLPLLLERCPDEAWLRAYLELDQRHCVRSGIHVATRSHIPFIFDEIGDIVAAFKTLRAELLPWQVALFFSRYGFAHLDELMALITRQSSAKTRSALLEEASKINDTSLAAHMLDHAQVEQTRLVAMRWLTGQGIHATLGLCELVGSRGKRRNQAIEVLRQIVSEGHADEVRQALAHVNSPTAIALVQQEVLAPHEAVSDAPTVLERLPPYGEEAMAFEARLSEEERAFFALDQAPVVWLEDHDAVVPVALLEKMLALSHAVDESWEQRTRPHAKRNESQAAPAQRALLSRMREGVDAASLGAWSWYLLERWWAQQNPAEMAWCVWMLGHAGTGREATLLDEKFRNLKRWFASGPRRDAWWQAVDSLAMIEDRASWMMLESLKNSGRNNDIRMYAARQIRTLCEARGWSEAMWQDRIVPDGGLDAHGTRWFDYGPRRFKLVFRGAFDVAFVDEQGEHFARLPAARKSDEVDAVSRARADYKVVKKQLEQVIAEQTRRFERALRSGLSWSAEDWRQHVFAHPLLRHFARKLLWAEIDAQDHLVSSFLPTEEGELLGPEGEPVRLAEGARVRLAHPAELSEEARRAWAEVFTDFEIVQPIAQLARPTQRSGASADSQELEALEALSKLTRPQLKARMEEGIDGAWHAHQDASYEPGAARLVICHPAPGWHVVLNLATAAWREANPAWPERGIYFLRPGSPQTPWTQDWTGGGTPVPPEEVPRWMRAEARAVLLRLAQDSGR